MEYGAPMDCGQEVLVAQGDEFERTRRAPGGDAALERTGVGLLRSRLAPPPAGSRGRTNVGAM